MCLPRIWWRLRVGIIQFLNGAEVIKLIKQRRNEMPKCYMTCNLFYVDSNERLDSMKYFFFGNSQKKQGINST